MSGGIHRSKKLSVKLTEQELAAWHEAANGEPLAVWVRIHMNRIVREELQRSFGEGEGEAVTAVPAAPAPSPEEWADAEIAARRAQLNDDNPEIEEPPVENVLSQADALSPECFFAPHHWQITRGERCPHCGGLAT